MRRVMGVAVTTAIVAELKNHPPVSLRGMHYAIRPSPSREGEDALSYARVIDTDICGPFLRL